MKKYIKIWLFIFVTGICTAQAQIEITGQVTDRKTKEAIPGVSVSVQGTTTGSTTDINGIYSISVPGGTNSLVFSFIGMKTKTLSIPANTTTLDVEMEADLVGLDEVVVVGYGTAKKVGTIVGSLKTVSEAKLKDKPTANVFDALQGKVAGLQTYTSSGEPTSVASVRLHGIGSLGAGSTPLYVLDGMPIAASTMLTLNSNDFESVTVLKDASATSIYGSRAANGVVYITTKSGKRNTKAVVTVSSTIGSSSLANEKYYNKMMNTKELTGLWLETGYRTQDQINELLAKYPHDTKWHKFYYKDSAPMRQTNVSVTGGSKKTSYYISGAYHFQDGLAQQSEYERYTLRSNIKTKVNDWLNMGINLNGSTDSRQTNPYTWNSTDLGLSVLAQPFYSPYDENGKRYEGRIPGWNNYDPLYLAKKLPSESNRDQVNGFVFVQLNPLPGLTIRSQAGINAYHRRSHSIKYPSYLASLGNGAVSESFASKVIRTITNTIEYKFNIQKTHKFTILAGQEGVDSDYEYFKAKSSGHTDDRLVLLTAGPENRDVGHSKSEYAYLSFFSRLDYSLSDKYFFDISLRQDASSRFGVNNREALFYAVGAMWNAKKESFFENLDFLSSLSVKASYGTSGNSSIGNYDHLATVGTTAFDGNVAWSIADPGNPNLSWEEQAKFTAGIKFSVLNDRFRFNIEYYNRSTSNQLISVPYPYTSGFSSILSNVGAIRNTGIDFEMDFDLFKNRSFYVAPYFNIGYNKNKITELFQGKDYWIIPNTGVCWAVGKPVSFFYPMFAGVNPDNGNPSWYLPGENITQTTKNKTTETFSSSALEQNTGINRYAPTAGGFGVDAGWKGFSLQADFSFALGKYLIVNDRFFTENANFFLGYNQSKTVVDYWKKPGDKTQFPRWGGSRFTEFDSRLIENASFMRMKNITLGYSLPENIIKKQNIISAIKVYVSGRNLWTVTNFSGPDPEVDSNLTLGANPNTKQYLMGIEVKF